MSTQGSTVKNPQGEITVQKVKAFSGAKVKDESQSKVTLNCSEATLTEFQKIIAGSKVLGAKYTNPYTGVEEHFPSDPKDFNARHLQILARNEYANVTGVMNTSLYNNLLTHDQIARIRCLVKSTNVCGIVTVHSKGGYPVGKSETKKLPKEQKFILVDQSGLQWQGDLRNTGGMFFYPNTPQSPEYTKYQKEMYEVMYGTARPEKSSGNSIDVTWQGVKGKLDLDLMANAIEVEFRQALDAVKNQGETLSGKEKINFKFLKAGMGFFADGLEGKDTVKFEQARLKGILQALKQLESLTPDQRQAALGKISRIELPYSANPSSPEITQTLKEIEASVQKLGLKWGGAPERDVFELEKDYVNASNNCGDPHAMIGNEGHYGSVDAMIACNAGVEHLNPAYNSKMQLKEMPVIQPTGEKGSIVYRQTTDSKAGAGEPEPIVSPVPESGDDDETPEGVPQPRQRAWANPSAPPKREVMDDVDSEEGVPQVKIGIHRMAKSLAGKTDELVRILEVQPPQPQPKPQTQPPILDTEGDTEDQEQEVGIEGDEQEQEEEVTWEVTHKQSIDWYQKKGKVEAGELDEQINNELEDIKQRAPLLAENMSLSEEQYEVYKTHFEEGPATFARLGQLLSENKNNASKVLDELSFMIKGAQQQYAENSDDEKIGAKLLALEKIRSILVSMIALDRNKNPYNDNEIARKLAIIDAYLEKTGMSAQERSSFSNHMKGVMDHIKHRQRVSVDADLFAAPFRKIAGKATHVTHTDKGGKSAFDTTTEPTLHDLTRDIKTIKITPVEQGKVIQLSFSYDRLKVIRGDLVERAKMMGQVGDSVTIALNEFNKGTKDNPVSLMYRPPEMAQPELALAMLIKIKEKAILEKKPFYVQDPKDPAKTIEITPKAGRTPEEKACFDHFGQEQSFTLVRSKNKEFEGAGKSKPTKDGYEIMLGKKPKDKEYGEMLDDRFAKFEQNLDKRTEKKLEEVSEKLSSVTPRKKLD
ncbi:MAG: hypothetical protein JSR17_03420 [Proteobacteria bacterium]|nr:hypothetical protein [Pseudomonadota bacterium]